MLSLITGHRPMMLPVSKISSRRGWRCISCLPCRSPYVDYRALFYRQHRFAKLVEGSGRCFLCARGQRSNCSYCPLRCRLTSPGPTRQAFDNDGAHWPWHQFPVGHHENNATGGGQFQPSAPTQHKYTNTEKQDHSPRIARQSGEVRPTLVQTRQSAWSWYISVHRVS